MSISNSQGGTEGPETILKILESKAFYENRFLKQVRSLYPNTGGAKFPRLVPTLYLQDCLARIPEEHQSDTCAISARLLVDSVKECPSPMEVREVIAEAALQSVNLTFDKLYERAKDFLAIPPKSAEVAGRWIERVIYTSVKKLTRERFVSVSAEEWRRVVSDVMLSDSVELLAYEVQPEAKKPSAKHDFKTLLGKSR